MFIEIVKLTSWSYAYASGDPGTADHSDVATSRRTSHHRTEQFRLWNLTAIPFARSKLEVIRRSYRTAGIIEDYVSGIIRRSLWSRQLNSACWLFGTSLISFANHFQWSLLITSGSDAASDLGRQTAFGSAVLKEAIWLCRLLVPMKMMVILSCVSGFSGMACFPWRKKTTKQVIRRERSKSRFSSPAEILKEFAKGKPKVQLGKTAVMVETLIHIPNLDSYPRGKKKKKKAHFIKLGFHWAISGQSLQSSAWAKHPPPLAPFTNNILRPIWRKGLGRPLRLTNRSAGSIFDDRRSHPRGSRWAATCEIITTSRRSGQALELVAAWLQMEKFWKSADLISTTKDKSGETDYTLWNSDRIKVQKANRDNVGAIEQIVISKYHKCGNFWRTGRSKSKKVKVNESKF